MINLIDLPVLINVESQVAGRLPELFTQQVNIRDTERSIAIEVSQVECLDRIQVVETRDESSDLGGTMRLGGQHCLIKPNTLAHQLYEKDDIIERHRHRYEVNNALLPKLEAAGLVVSGLSKNEGLVEIIELKEHPWYFACQFHPEFTSNPRDGHPVFIGFIDAAKQIASLRSQ